MKSSRIVEIIVVLSLIVFLIPLQCGSRIFIAPIISQEKENIVILPPSEITNGTRKLLSTKNGLEAGYQYIDYYPESILVGNGTAGLLMDQGFNRSDAWDWTSSQNISSSRDVAENLTVFQHVSPPSPPNHFNDTSFVNEERFRRGVVISGNFTYTHVKDDVPYVIEEELHDGELKYSTELNITGLNQSISTYNLNIYYRNSGQERMRVRIYNFTEGDWFGMNIQSLTYDWANFTFDSSVIEDTGTLYMNLRDGNRTGDTVAVDRIYLDYFELAYENITYVAKNFTQMASINQTFHNPHNYTQSFNLTFDYKVSNFTMIYGANLSIHLWNETTQIDTGLQYALTSATSWTGIQEDISALLDYNSTYNFSIVLSVHVLGYPASNITLLLDNVQIRSVPVIAEVQVPDNSTIQLFENNDTLDLEFNSTVHIRELVYKLNVSILSRTSNESYGFCLYNFSSSTWTEFVKLNDTAWTWKIFSISQNAADFVSATNLTMIKITDYGNSDALDDYLQIDFILIRKFSLPINITVLEAPTEETQVGDDVVVVVYVNDTVGNPITGAVITTNYTEDSYFVNDNANGNYTITLYTSLASPGEKWINTTANMQYYGLASSLFNFSVGGFDTNITITKGAVQANGTWTANPQPFVNDTSTIIQIYYNGTGIGLKKAQIFARPDWDNNTYFSYFDLGSIYGPAFNGLYNITLDTTGLHAGENHSVFISASKEAYNPSNLTLDMPIQHINTTLSTEGFENVTNYEGETATIGASYVDIINSRPIQIYSPDQGNVTWEIEGTPAINGTMELFVWSYKAELDLPALGIQPGNYNITIRANATDYMNATAKIELNVLPKIPTNMTLTVPALAQTGKNLTIDLILEFGNGTFIKDALIDLRILYMGATNQTQTETLVTDENGTAGYVVNNIPDGYNQSEITVEYLGSDIIGNSTNTSLVQINPKDKAQITFIDLPQQLLQGTSAVIKAKLETEGGDPIIGETLEFSISYGSSGSPQVLTGITNIEGVAQVSFTYDSWELSIKISVSFEATPSVENAGATTEITGTNLIVLSIPALIAIAIVGIIASSVFLVYNYSIRRPREQKELNKLKELASKFKDIKGIYYLIILHKQARVPIFEYSMGITEINPVLISGFLQAITTFKDELAISKAKGKETGWVLEYENFKISWFTGDKTYFTILSEDRLSDLTKKNVEALIREFELKFQKFLDRFTGDIDVFEPAGALITKHLEIDLLLPQRVDFMKWETESKSLSRTEMALTNLGASLEEQTNHFHLDRLLTTASSARGESELKLLGIIYGLWKLGIFRPKLAHVATYEGKGKKS